MWPWGHLAFGYLLYSVYSRLVSKERLDGYSVLFVAVGTQFPDLIDKPLAWTFNVLPGGRTLAHSVFAAVFASLVVGGYCRRQGRSDLGAAFTIGYFSHLIADGYTFFLSGQYAFLSYLVWPLLPPPPFENTGGFLSHLRNISFSPNFMFQILLVAVVYVVWIEDGAPGRSTVGRLLHDKDETDH